MGYKLALEAAGAIVHHYEEFGSYQGDWLALVEYQEQVGWIHGCYGSCSGCDAFEAEFGWSQEEFCSEHRYGEEGRDDCEDCKIASEKYHKRLVDFGKHYLEDLKSQKEIEKATKQNWDWDMDAVEMYKWVCSVRDNFNDILLASQTRS